MVVTAYVLRCQRGFLDPPSRQIVHWLEDQAKTYFSGAIVVTRPLSFRIDHREVPVKTYSTKKGQHITGKGTNVTAGQHTSISVPRKQQSNTRHALTHPQMRHANTQRDVQKSHCKLQPEDFAQYCIEPFSTQINARGVTQQGRNSRGERGQKTD